MEALAYWLIGFLVGYNLAYFVSTILDKKGE